MSESPRHASASSAQRARAQKVRALRATAERTGRQAGDPRAPESRSSEGISTSPAVGLSQPDGASTQDEAQGGRTPVPGGEGPSGAVEAVPIGQTRVVRGSDGALVRVSRETLELDGEGGFSAHARASLRRIGGLRVFEAIVENPAAYAGEKDSPARLQMAAAKVIVEYAEGKPLARVEHRVPAQQAETGDLVVARILDRLPRVLAALSEHQRSRIEALLRLEEVDVTPDGGSGARGNGGGEPAAAGAGRDDRRLLGPAREPGVDGRGVGGGGGAGGAADGSERGDAG